MNQRKLRVLDLFSGIGGFSLGLERAGMTTVAFCEIEPFCREVLKKHWPDVPIFNDVRSLTHEQIGSVDVICGGFPCQDISFAGKGAGLEGERSGLWFEFARLIGKLRPTYVIAENVSALRSRGLERVLGSLAALGYDAEWHCIPAAAVGAPHKRDRIWIVAYPAGGGKQQGGSQCYFGGLQKEVLRTSRYSDDWKTEPAIPRVVDGFPGRIHPIRALGNAVVPQIPEIIGRAIMAADARVI